MASGELHRCARLNEKRFSSLRRWRRFGIMIELNPSAVLVWFCEFCQAAWLGSQIVRKRVFATISLAKRQEKRMSDDLQMGMWMRRLARAVLGCAAICAAASARTDDSKPHNGILATAMQWAGYVEIGRAHV